jgi:hypothetical protein
MKFRRVASLKNRTYNGVVYRSGFEARLAADHHRRGLAVEYEAETLPYTTYHTCRVDWRVTTNSGKVILVESKGWFPPEDKAKVLALIESNPGVDYRLLFERPSPKLEAWAKKRKIKYAVGTIPDAWLRE